MKRNIFILSFLLMTILPIVGNAQQSESVAEIKAVIRGLENTISDPDISDGAKQKYKVALLKKKVQLTDIFEQQKRGLQERRRGTDNADEIGRIDAQIRDINNEIDALLENRIITSESRPVENNQNGDNQPATSSNDVQPQPQSQLQSQPQPQNALPTADCGRPDGNFVPDNSTLEGRFKTQVKIAVQCIKTDKTRNLRADINDQRDLTFLVPLALAAKKAVPIAVTELTAQAEEIRNDKQVGSGSSSSGSTSLVTKGAVPAIFGVAYEYGAIERTTNGTTLTFRGNPIGIIEAVRRKGYIEAYQNDTTLNRFLRNFAFGLSFDTSRGNSNGTFTGDKDQVSSFSFRYNFINQRDPRDRRFTRDWERLVNQNSVQVVRDLGALARRLLFTQAGQNAPPEFLAWVAETKGVIRDAAPDEVEPKLAAQLEKLRDIKMPPEINEIVNSFSGNYKNYLDERDKILKKIAEGWLVSVEYTNDRPVDSSSISNLNFIAERGGPDGAFDLTFNSSVSFFNKKPTGMNTKRLRDFNFSGQVDIPLNGIDGDFVWLLTFAGKYKRLLEDEPIPNSTDVIKKGDIGVFQAKTVIPIPGTAFKIPISVSFANRTELIKEREVRVNFGFTFDIDSILARFNPFTKK